MAMALSVLFWGSLAGLAEPNKKKKSYCIEIKSVTYKVYFEPLYNLHFFNAIDP